MSAGMDSPMDERKLLRIQAASGTVFLAFALFHLANTGIAALGVEAFERTQAIGRVVYQQPLVEIVALLIPLAVHWTAAVIRLRRDGFRRRNQSLRARLHRYSGYYLLAFIWGHVAATRAPGLFAGVELGFGGVAYTFEWMPYWFYPYYTLLGLSGLYHSVNGAFLAASIFGHRLPGVLRHGPGFWVPWSAAAILLVLGLAALSGHLFPIPDPAESGYAVFMTEFMAD